MQINPPGGTFICAADIFIWVYGAKNLAVFVARGLQKSAFCVNEEHFWARDLARIIVTGDSNR